MQFGFKAIVVKGIDFIVVYDQLGQHITSVAYEEGVCIGKLVGKAIKDAVRFDYLNYIIS